LIFFSALFIVYEIERDAVRSFRLRTFLSEWEGQHSEGTDEEELLGA
jgi:hypothetical protein